MGFWTPEVACQRNPNDVYTVAVKTDTGVIVGHLPRKIGSLFSVSASEWYNQWKLAHGPVKFPARSISHFANRTREFCYMAKDFLNRQSKLTAPVSSHVLLFHIYGVTLAKESITSAQRIVYNSEAFKVHKV